MKEAQPGLRAALDARRGRGSRSRASRRCRSRGSCDHHLSWAQWFADSDVPGVLRARWFEQRHMLHHTRRWNRDHIEELHSAWLNGVGMLVWENVFGAWVGWNERDKALLRAMLPVQREHAELLATGEWTPLAAASPDDRGSSPRAGRDGETTLWALANRGDAYAGPVGELEVELPARGIAAFVGSEQVMVARRRRRDLPGARGGSRAGAGRPRRRGARRLRGGRAAAADRRLPPPRDGRRTARRRSSRSGSRCRRGCTPSSRSSARRRAAGSPSRSRRGR